MVPHESTATEAELFYVQGGSTRHLRACPHLQVTESERVLAATGEAPAGLPVCQWSQAEIDGVGRTYYPTFDAALERFGAPVENRARMREIAAGQTYDRVWTPYSMSYVAIGWGEAGPAVAWFLKSVVYTGAQCEELAGTGQTSRTATSVEDRPVALCPFCFTTLSNSGHCSCRE